MAQFRYYAIMSACEICKDSKKSPISQTVIYDPAGRLIPINLCRKHDHELFIMGQYRFLKQYYDQVGSSYRIRGLQNPKKSA